MRFIYLLLITVSLTSCISLKKSSFRKGMKLVWSDEFNYNGLPDSNKWSYEVGGNGCHGNRIYSGFSTIVQSIKMHFNYV